MIKNQNIFKRYEKKYMLTSQQYKQFQEEIKDRFVGDRFENSTISNIYFDTPDFKLIRESLNKPVYKEKLRLRTYQTPDNNTTAFIELKKKYMGIVYKRRISTEYIKAYEYLYNGIKNDNPSQIQKEIDYLISFYKGISPAMYIYYDRKALFCKDMPDLRITFDSNITWRNYSLELTKGVCGEKLLNDNMVLMEIKIPDALPLWLTHILDKLNIYQTSFSKYGAAYNLMISKNNNLKGVICCA